MTSSAIHIKHCFVLYVLCSFGLLCTDRELDLTLMNVFDETLGWVGPCLGLRFLFANGCCIAFVFAVWQCPGARLCSRRSPLAVRILLSSPTLPSNPIPRSNGRRYARCRPGCLATTQSRTSAIGLGWVWRVPEKTAGLRTPCPFAVGGDWNLAPKSLLLVGS